MPSPELRIVRAIEASWKSDSAASGVWEWRPSLRSFLRRNQPHFAEIHHRGAGFGERLHSNVHRTCRQFHLSQRPANEMLEMAGLHHLHLKRLLADGKLHLRAATAIAASLE